MSEFKIRQATRDDCQQLADMVHELAVFEQMEDQVKMNVETLIEDGFEADPSYFQCLIAELDGEAIGYALYFYTYSAEEGGEVFYLEDLYIREKHRGKGRGKMLFKAIVEEAKRRNSTHMQWCVLNWNNKALDFYKSMGAFDLTLTKDIHMWRLTSEAIRQVLN